MSERDAASSDDVFLNVPFDANYRPIFEALLFGVFFCGFRPRSALEMDDASDTRLLKIYRIIEQCRFGVHDISRVELDTVNRLPRFNMPFELGLFYGAKRYGDAAQKSKRCLVFDVERFRYQKFLSDLSGADICAHGADPFRALGELRDWLASASRRVLPPSAAAEREYRAFLKDRPALAAAAGFDGRPIPYADLERLIVSWLTKPVPAPQPRRTRKRKS